MASDITVQLPEIERNQILEVQLFNPLNIDTKMVISTCSGVSEITRSTLARSRQLQRRFHPSARSGYPPPSKAGY